MAAEVSSLMRFLNGGDANDSAGRSTAQMTTMDLLGGCCNNNSTSSSIDESKELDLDLQVPCGWEKRLDLKSGKVYLIKRCDNPSNNSSPTSLEYHKPQNTISSKFQDMLNVPTTPKKQSVSLFDETTLDLKLISSSSVYQSVCTLDKVKYALERAEKENYVRKRSISISNKSSSPLSNSSSSIKDSYDSNYDEDRSPLQVSYASGCPCCLMYVLISTSNPKCPRCNSNVPLPLAMKKPRIDLNIAF